MLRRALFTSALLGLLLLAAPRAGLGQEMDAVVLAYVQAWNSGELDRLGELVTPDFQRHAGPDESSDSAASLEELIRQTRSIYDHLRISVDDHTTGGDRGASRGRFYGVHRDVGAVIDFPVMSIYRFAEGRIAEEWIVGDNFLSLVTLGYELVPPGFEAIPPAPPPATVPDTPTEEGG